MVMTTRKTTLAAGVAAAAGLSFGAYALGSQAGDGSAAAKAPARSASSTARTWHHGGLRFGARVGARGAGLDALATKLGVPAATLRSALQATIAEQRAAGGDPRERMSVALADALNLPAAKVKAALDAVRPDRGDRRDGFAKALADALSIPVATVQSALAAQRDDRHDPGSRADDEAAFAKALGVTTAQLQAAFDKLRAAGPPKGAGPGAGPDLSALATKLGVSTTALSAALDKVRTAADAQRKAERTAFVAALAKRLGLPASKVEAAVPDFPGPGGHRGGGGLGHGPFGPGGEGPDGAPPAP